MMADGHNYVTRTEVSHIDKRVGRVEDRLTRSETKLEHLEDTLTEIRSDTKKIIWLIVSTVVLAILRVVVIDGGL